MSDEKKVYLQVTALRDRFRRAGFLFTDRPQVVECSPEQAKAIWAEDGTMLKVSEAKPGDEPVIVSLESLERRIAALSAQVAQRDAKIAENSSKKGGADAAKLREELDAAKAKIAKLEADLAKANADIEALTAPSK